MDPDGRNQVPDISFSNAGADVFYDEQVDCVCIELKGYLESHIYRGLLDRVIDLLKKYNTSKLLGNTSNSEVISVEDQDWSNNDWAKRAVKAGLRHNAIVLPKDIFGRLSIESVIDNAKIVKVKYFNSMAEAKDWLKKIT